MKVIICSPGKEFSGKFLRNLTELICYFDSNGVEYEYISGYLPNIYESRNKMLLGSPEQTKVLNGEDYDYILWIDDDITFSVEDFIKLQNADKEVIGGMYLMADGQQYAAVKYWNEDYFKQHGTFEFLTRKDIQIRTIPMRVEYLGFGFLLVKKGVFEQMEYPWFEPTTVKIGSCVDFSMEDVTFCLKCKDKGIKVFAHPSVKVGHNKTLELR